MEPTMERGRMLLGRFIGVTANIRISLSLISLGMLIALLMVLRDGGTPSAYAHFAYAPTIIAAMRFHAVGGLICGFLGGFVVGPLSAWILGTAEVLSLGYDVSWIVRAAWIGVVGFTLGWLFTFTRQQAGILDWHLHTDRATALPNLFGLRRQLHGLIEQELALPSPSGRELAVTALKVANYDDLMGTFGHDGSDAIMRELGHRVREGSPSSAVLGRTGADELIMVESVDRDSAPATSVQALQDLVQPTLHVGAMQVYVDTVFGVVRSPIGAAVPEELLVQAGAAAGRAHSGGTRIAIHDADKEEARKGGVRLLGQVLRAIENGEMSLVYQPKLDLHTHRFTGVEALARWDHPEHGPVPPGRFVPLLEDTSIIDTFTRWVLTTAMQQNVEWHAQGQAPTVAINISARNLTSGSLLRHVDELLTWSGLPPSSLELEITETALMDVDASHLGLLAGLREKGVRIAIDDFGTGYASLAYIRDLPADILKLDRSFIQSAPNRPQEEQILKRIVQIARDLRMKVVGEGVESEQMLDLLTKLGCDQAQGYFVARPVQPSEVQPLLARRWSGSATRQEPSDSRRR